MDRARATDPGVVVLTSNYGEAGALDRFSRRPEVPVFSAHNALADTGPPPRGTRTVVFVGGQLADHADLFARCDTVDRLRSGLPVDNEEEGEPVAVCTGPTADWDRLWVELRHLD